MHLDRHLPSPTRPQPLPWAQDADHDETFVEMLAAYRATGGVARAVDIAGSLRHGRDQGLPVIARWIAAGHVVHFQWSGDYWLPVFQFVRPGMSLRPGLTRVLAQLSPVLDAWDVAQWFVHPSPWLGGQRPVSLIATQARHVEEAARADRFALAG